MAGIITRPFIIGQHTTYKDGLNVLSGGTRIWTLHGKYHRVDGPAIEYTNGCGEWFLDGKYHRVGGPAVCQSNGSYEWYLHGVLHRDDGPAVFNSVFEEWFQHGKRHREGGPALKTDSGLHAWIVENEYHRVDGPAVVGEDGGCEWYVRGRRFTEEEFTLYVDQLTGDVLVPPGKKLEHDDE